MNLTVNLSKTSINTDMDVSTAFITPNSSSVDSTTTQPLVKATSSENTHEFIVKYEGAYYDIHAFLSHHPAGRSVIEEHRETNGIDITDIFDRIGHSDYAKKIMMKYRLKTLITTDRKSHTLMEEEDRNAKSKRTKVSYDLQFLGRKLFTKEDQYMVHKFFGLLALGSYAYRHVYVFSTTRTLGFTGNWLDVITLIVHFMLTFTSLIFHVLERRIVEKPLIIYEEYRLHAILFTARSVFVSLFGMYIDKFLPNAVSDSPHSFNSFDSPHSDHTMLLKQIILPLGVCSIHLMVDFVTSRYGTKGVTAVRITDDGNFRGLKLFYSYYQFAALGSHLVINRHTCDLGYNTLIAIQSSAFLMTLRRKSIIRWYWHAIWYSIALVLSYSVMYVEIGPMFFVYVAIAFYLRTQWNWNKYLLWMVYIVTIYTLNLQSYE